MIGAMTDGPDTGHDGANRLVVLWLCWLVLAVFLLAAGVAVLGG